MSYFHPQRFYPLQGTQSRNNVPRRNVPRRNVPRSHFVQQQIQQQTARQQKIQTNHTSKMKRTAITIDSRFRTQFFSPTTDHVLGLGPIIPSLCQIRQPSQTKNIEIIFTYSIPESTVLDKINTSTSTRIIITDIQPNDGKTFHGIPLSSLLFDEKKGAPQHRLVSITPNENFTEYEVVIRLHSYIYNTETTIPRTLTLDSLDMKRIISMEKAWSQPNEYTVYLNRIYTNVVAVRLLNTVIPNTAYMINSSFPKNNKLRWINKRSRSVLYSKIPIEESDNPFSQDTTGLSWTPFDIHSLQNIYVEQTNENQNPMTYLSTTLHHSPTPLEENECYFIHNTTLFGGQYTASILSEELSSQINDNADLEKTQTHFCNFNRSLLQYSDSESYSSRFQKGPSNQGRFFIDINDNKKFIEFKQYEQIYWNNRLRILNNTVTNESGPCIVNEGFPWLYIKHPGHHLVSGDSVRIDHSFDIANISAEEINREHTVFVPDVFEVTLTTTFDLTNLHKYELIHTKDAHGRLLWARIIHSWNVTLSASSTATKLYVETCFHDRNIWNSDHLSDLFGYTWKTKTLSFSISSILPKYNAHHGYAVKLSTIPTRTFLDGVGNTKLFIGTPVEFSLLMGMDESPGNVLGFSSNTQGEKDKPLEFSKAISNTVPIHSTDILSSHLLKTQSDNCYHTLILQCKKEAEFTKGDCVYIDAHAIDGHKKRHHSSFTYEITDSILSGHILLRPEGTEKFNLPSSLNKYTFENDNSTQFFVHDHKTYTETTVETTVETTDIIESAGLDDNVYTGSQIQNESYPMHSRLRFPEMSSQAVKVDAHIATITLSTLSENIHTPGEQWIYVHNPNTVADIPSAYYKTHSRIQSDHTISFSVDASINDFAETSDSSINITFCNDPHRNILNSKHIVHDILPDEYGKMTRVVLHILKNHCNFTLDSSELYSTLPSEYILQRLKTTPTELEETFCTRLGTGGSIFMKEIDKPYTLQNNYLYMLCPTLQTTLYGSSSLNENNIFSKIMLPGTNGEYVFNTHISYPKVFSDHPLRSLDHLHFKFVNEDGELYNFNELDHSFVIEITELNDRLEYLNVSSGTVQN